MHRKIASTLSCDKSTVARWVAVYKEFKEKEEKNKKIEKNTIRISKSENGSWEKKKNYKKK